MLTKLRPCLSILLLALVSCAPAAPTVFTSTESPAKETAPSDLLDKEAAFLRMFPLEEMNTLIRFLPTEDKFSVTKCDKILALKNLSDKKFVFSFEKGLKMLIFIEGKWKDIADLMQYIPAGGNFQISPKGPDYPGENAFFICPDLTGYELPNEIRVVVLGTLDSSPPEDPEQVGAYMDIFVDE